MAKIKPISKYLRMPDGSGFRTHLIGSVSQTNSGVSITGSNGQMLAFIEVAGDELKRMVVDILIDCADAGKHFVQPDWDLIERLAEEEKKGDDC